MYLIKIGVAHSCHLVLVNRSKLHFEMTHDLSSWMCHIVQFLFGRHLGFSLIFPWDNYVMDMNNFMYTGVDKSRFIVVSTQNTGFILVLLINYCTICF